MRDADRFKLLGTYRTPRVRIGRVLMCEARDCDVIVAGYSDARIPWPMGRKHGSPARGLVVFGGLAEAVKRESNLAVCYWFGVTPQTVSKWRAALGVESMNAGTGTLREGYGREEWFAAARAKGQATPWTDERRETMSKLFRHKPQPANSDGPRRRRCDPHTPETRAKLRIAAAARLARGVVPSGRAWTPAEDELVRTLPVSEVALRTKRTIISVYKRRRKLKLAGQSLSS